MAPNRLPAIVVAVLTTTASARAIASLAPPPRRPLAAGTSESHPFGRGQTHRYALHARTGDLIDVVVEPHGIDLAVALIDPAGTRVSDVDLSTDPDSSEAVLAVASRDGAYELVVTAPNAGTAPGRYTITAAAVRHASDDEVARADASKQLEEARHAFRSPQPGSREHALEQLAEARDVFARIKDASGVCRAALQTAWSEYDLQRPTSAESARQAESACRAAGDLPRASDAAQTRGLSELRGSDPANARAVLADALAEASRGGFRGQEAKIRNALGIAFGRTGDAEAAVAELRQALALARQFRADLVTAILNNLGIATKNLGDFKASLAYYTDTLAAARERNDRVTEANALNNVGNLYRLLGENGKSLTAHRAALGLARSVGNREHEARALNALGSTTFKSGDYRTALDYHEQALAIRRELADPAAEAAALDGAAQALQKLGDGRKALAYLADALRLERQVAERYAEAGSLLHLARVERDLGDTARALEHIEESVGLTDSLRSRVLNPDLRASFVAAVQERYELLVDLLMQLDRERPGAGYAQRALEASDRGRARVLIESLLAARADLRGGIDPALLAAERDYERRLDQASARVTRASARQGADATAARAAFDELTAEFRDIEARIRRESPRYAALTQPAHVTVDEIQHELLDEDTLMLEFRVGEERSWLWVIGPASLETIELPGRLAIEAVVRRAYDAIGARRPRVGELLERRAARLEVADDRWRRASAQLGRMLFAEAAARAQASWPGKRLVIVADGALEYLPFAALPEPMGANRPLVAAHEIVVVPSAGALAVIRAETGRREPSRKSLAIVADPVFDDDDPRARRLAGRPASASSARMSRLPFSSDEARAIGALVPAGERLEAIGFDANRETVMSGALSGYRYVHFATHGVLDAAHPERSGLVLSLVAPDGSPRAGFLRMADVYTLKLPAELVVLSACDTALGKEILGEGMVGLTRGFMYAGARRVVASLWAVDDVATAELMRRFYRFIFVDRLAPSAALRAAQRAVAADPRWASPFYWSAFVIQGDWR